MSKTYSYVHNGTTFTICEYDSYALWNIPALNAQRQESNAAKANRAARKYIDKHRS
jgi:hypothetical protein